MFCYATKQSVFLFYDHFGRKIMDEKIRNLIAQYLLEISKSKLKLQNYTALDLLTDEIINEELAYQEDLNDRVEKLREVLKNFNR